MRTPGGLLNEETNNLRSRKAEIDGDAFGSLWLFLVHWSTLNYRVTLVWSLDCVINFPSNINSATVCPA